MTISKNILEKQLLHLSTILPDNIVLVAVIALIPVTLVYALVEWQFARTEVVGAIVKSK